MKRIFFLIAIVVMAIGANAQTVDNAYVTVTFKGDRAVITEKNATANAAIAALVESVKAKDFVDGHCDVYVGDPSKTGMEAVWYFIKTEAGYGMGYLDDAAGEDYSKYKTLADAKKAMIKIMREHYASYGTLDPR
ncbi:MAG: hypothetical protein K0B37_10930 [Bacteroidales bacterium]|nr:hypothetical protein [Bacteroidales bacterium]